MKWVFVIVNLFAAVGFVLLAGMAVAAHRTHAYSTYREFVHQGVLLERPDYDIAQRLETIAAAGSYSQWMGWLGAAACVVNAAVLAVGFRHAARDD